MTLHDWAPAKINLYLHVTGRRPDGYHSLDSLAVFAGAADRLAAAPSDRLALEISGPFAAGLDTGEGNLVLRAAAALAAAAGERRGARLHLQKNLPVASGIGGGSADAAAALRLLNRLWGLGATSAALRDLALGLGADVPVCVPSAPARMRGIGERLDPAPRLPPFGLVLANPGVALATADVFRAREGAFSPEAELPAAWPDAAALAADLERLRNDLETPACRLRPEVAAVLQALSAAGCRLARMSGSGATCFGLTATPAQAHSVAASLAGRGWWLWAGTPFAPAPAPALEAQAGGA